MLRESDERALYRGWSRRICNQMRSFATSAFKRRTQSPSFCVISRHANATHIAAKRSRTHGNIACAAWRFLDVVCTIDAQHWDGCVGTESLRCAHHHLIKHEVAYHEQLEA